MSRSLIFEIDDVVVYARLLAESAPSAVRALVKSLPVDATISQCMWSGAAVSMLIPGEAFTEIQQLEHPVCSIYPGTFVVRPYESTLMLSYGTTAEIRTALGTDYGVRVAECEGDCSGMTAALERLATKGDGKARLWLADAS